MAMSLQSASSADCARQSPPAAAAACGALGSIGGALAAPPLATFGGLVARRARSFVAVTSLARRAIGLARRLGSVPGLGPRPRALACHLDADLAAAILLAELDPAITVSSVQRRGRGDRVLEGHVTEATRASAIMRHERVSHLTMLLESSAQHLAID